MSLLGASLEDIGKKYPRLLMALAHHRTTKGGRMEFADKPWLTAIYQDNSKEMVIIKCSQVHMTEHALCAMFTFAKSGHRGMYILPSKEHRKTFVADRVNRLKDYSELYSHAIKEGSSNESDSNVYKSIFGQGWKFVGSTVRKDFFEFPCDILFFDEYDELDQDNLWYAYDRVANVPNPIIWKFGNPTRDGFGIHGEYLKSDQKEWHVDCNECGHEQVLDWYIHFVQKVNGKWQLRDVSGRPVCIDCGKPFDRLNFGRWIALNPASKVSGYRISRLFIRKDKEKNDIYALFEKFLSVQDSPTGLQNFHNNYLGVTFENTEFKLTREAVLRSRYTGDIEFDPTRFRTVMGVDQGKLFTCVISLVHDNEIIDLYYARVKRWADVAKLEDQFHVIQTVVDAQGGGYAETRDFVASGGHRYMCYYRPKDQVKGEYKQDQRTQVVETNRTELLDLTAMAVIGNKAHSRRDCEALGGYIDEMIASSRITDAGGNPVWTKGTDHFFHASAYRYLAWKLSGMSHSMVQPKGWSVTTKTETIQDKLDAGKIGLTQEELDELKTKPREKKRSWGVSR